MATTRDTFAEGLTSTMDNNPNLRGVDFSTLDEATRGLIAEDAARQTRGARGAAMIGDTQVGREFIGTGRVAAPTSRGFVAPPASGSPYSGVSGGSAGQGGSQGATGGQGVAPTGGLADIYSALQRYSQPTQAGPTEDQLYQQNVARMQAAIDAINQRYTGLLDDARDKGFARGQRAKALANTGGSLYSPRTDAVLSENDDITSEAMRALEAQRGAELAAVMGNASDRAEQRAAQQAAAAAQRDEAYINNLFRAYSVAQGDEKLQLERALAEAELTGQYQNSPTLQFLRYQQDVANTGFDQDFANRELEFRIADAERKNYQIVQLDDGTVVSFDPQTGTQTILGNYARPTSGGGGGGGSRGGGYSSDAGIRYGGFDSGLTDAELQRDYYMATGKVLSDPKDIAQLRSTAAPQYSDAFNYDYYGPGGLGPDQVVAYNPFTRDGATSDLFAGIDLSGGTL